MVGKRVGLAALGIVLANGAWAWTSSLNLIPIAEVLRHREIEIGYGITGDPHSEAHDASLQLGLFDKLEIGGDQDLRGRATFNLKLRFYERGDTAMAAGFTDHNGRSASWFGVVSQGVGNLTVHGGYWRTNDRDSLILGADYTVGDGSIMLDYVSGPDGAVWLGFCCPIPRMDRVTVGMAFGVSNTRSTGLQHNAYIMHSFRF